MRLRPGYRIETVIKDLAFDGKAVGAIDGKIIFLDGGLPGEKVQAVVTKSKARFDTGHVTAIIEKGPERIEAPCRHFDICGGCTWQDLDYERQLYYKRKQVVDCLEHLAKLKDIEVAPAIPCDSPFHYRNKMEYSFNRIADGGFVLGLHKRGHYDDIFQLEQCLLPSPAAAAIVLWFQEYVKRSGLKVYDVNIHDGFWRFLMIRESFARNEIMINLITTEVAIPEAGNLAKELTAAFPAIKTIVQNINTLEANIARGEREITLYGPGYIEEEFLGKVFRVYAGTFLQTNSRQAARLYQAAYELLEPKDSDRLLDLYCGIGTIGLCVASQVGEVLGVELEPSAVRSAEENARLNNITNARFMAGLAQDLMREQRKIFEDMNCAIIDPPRAGMHKKALNSLLEIKYPRLVYISCNPSTFARDAALLVETGYKLGRVIPVDMFPHTMHIELVASFTRGI